MALPPLAMLGLLCLFLMPSQIKALDCTPFKPASVVYEPSNYQQRYAARLWSVHEELIYSQCTGLAFAQHRWETAGGWPSYEDWTNIHKLEVEYSSCLPKNKLLDVFLGDSLLFYLPHKYQLSDTRSVLNFAIAGDTTRKAVGRVETAASVHADRYFLLFGINDLLFPSSDAPIRSHFDGILRNIRSIGSQIQSGVLDADIYLISLLPTDGTRVANDTIREFNNALRTMAGRHRFHYLDVHRALRNEHAPGRAGERIEASLTTDGLHLNEKGYDRLMEAINGAMGNLSGCSRT